MKFSKINLTDYLTLAGIFIISIIVFNTIIYRVNPFEFDTDVYFAILKNLIASGKVSIPIVAREIASICGADSICSYLHPDIDTQAIYEQLPPDYTSGMTLLFLPTLINKILGIFASIKISLNYLTEIYALGAVVLYALSSFIIIKLSKFNLYELLSFFLATLIANILHSQFSANGIVGELYASMLISSVVFSLALSFTKDLHKNYYIACAFFLGIAIESKISTVFTASTILGIILIKSYFADKNLKTVLLIAISFTTPKLIAFIYYFSALNYSLENLILFYQSIQAVYAHNANAGLTWGDTSIAKQISNLFSNSETRIFMYVGIFSYIASLSIIVYKKLWSVFSLALAASLILTSSLIYPVTFKFPYTRIFATFYSVLPMVFILLGKTIEAFLIPKKAGCYVLPIILVPLSAIALIINPIQTPIFHKPLSSSFPPLHAFYPNLKFETDAVFLTSHFFSMPWDIYLTGIIDGSSPLDVHNIYSEQTYGISSAHKNNFDAKNIYLLQSCRWGHCSKSNQISLELKANKGGVPRLLNCKYLEPEQESYYRIYRCI